MIEEIVEIYLQNIKFLAETRQPHVIVCLIPQKIAAKLLSRGKSVSEGGESDDEQQHTDFHDMLKAKSMRFKIPIQIILETTLATEQPPPGGKSDLQDVATRAWNLCTALYYKAGGIAWKAHSLEDHDLTCFVGISFYRTRDKKELKTSMAQIFDEQGRGVILRGGPAEKDKEGDRQPHLSGDEAYRLLSNAIESYRFAENITPKRIVVHKSSKNTQREIDGFMRAIEEKGISTFDFVTVLESDVRLFRNASYPPLRGTCLQLSENNFLLYAKGSVNYYQTYAGMYVPHPIEIRAETMNSSPQVICNEILALSKMNWNNTQFDRRMPITIDCSRRVGAILKYVDDDEIPQLKYSFYM